MEGGALLSSSGVPVVGHAVGLLSTWGVAQVLVFAPSRRPDIICR